MAFPPENAPASAMPASPVDVIGPQYCTPKVVDLTIVSKDKSIANNFKVTDVNGNLIFKAKASVLTLHNRRVLMDAAANPIVTLRRKIRTMHDRWQVFRGESSEDHDLIFSVKRTSAIQLKTKLDVFLANNTNENVCDFKVKCRWSEHSCVVYAGESNVTLAQMQKKQTSGLFGKERFNVSVNPNVDYAFIVALIVILDQINEDEEAAATVFGAAATVVGAAATVAEAVAAEVAGAVAEVAGAAAAEVAGAVAEVVGAAAEVAGEAIAEALSQFLG